MPYGKKSLLIAVSLLLSSSFASAETSARAKRAEKLAAAGKTEEARAIYKELMAKDPAREPALVQEGKEGLAALLLAQARAAQEAGAAADANGLARSLLTDYRDTASANDAARVLVASQLELSKGMISDKKYADCVARAGEARKLIPAGNDALVADVDKMLSALSADLRTAGEEGVALGKYEPAQKLLEHAAAAAVGAEEAALCRLALGKCFRRAGQDDRAVPLLQDVAGGGTPSAAAAHAELYLAHRRLGNDAEALNSARQAVSLAPDNGDYLFQLAQACASAGKEEEAKKAAVKAVEKLQAEIPRTYRNKEILQDRLGQAHMILGNYTEAAVEFEKALARDPNLFETRKGLAAAQFRDGNYKSAIDSFDALIRALGADFKEAEERAAKDRTAAEPAKRAEELRREIAYFHFQKGLAFEKLGLYDKALDECRAGLEGVSTQEAAAAQKRLQAARAAEEKKAEPTGPPAAESGPQ